MLSRRSEAKFMVLVQGKRPRKVKGCRRRLKKQLEVYRSSAEAGLEKANHYKASNYFDPWSGLVASASARRYE